MNYLTNFYQEHKKLLTYGLFFVVFFVTLCMNVPTWVLGSLLYNYSQNKLKLYNTSGTFWNGSGLLVATNPKTQHSAPLILLDWKLKLGLTRYVNLDFYVGSSKIANIYLDKNGVNLDSLNMSLSVSQVTELFGLIKNLGLSGNIQISGNNIKYNSRNPKGVFKIDLSAIASSMSPVNPLGDYKISYDLSSGGLEVSSSANSNLILNGAGSLSSLVLSGKIASDKKDKLLQFITVMGLPQPDGSYSLKIF